VASSALLLTGEQVAGIRRRRGFDFATAVFALLVLCLALLVVMPTGWLLWYSVTNDQGQIVIGNWLAVSVAALCAVVALPLAFLIARTDVPLRRTIRAAVTASFVTPPFLGAVAWEVLAAPNSGLLNVWARQIFGFGRYQHVFNIFTVSGVIFATTCYTFPYVFTLLTNAFERVPSELEDASAVIGANRWRTARDITVPLVLPALLAGMLVAFLQALTLFGTPAILALPAGFNTLTTKLWSLFQYPPQTHLAAAASMPLLLITALVLWGQRRVLGTTSPSRLPGRTCRWNMWASPCGAFRIRRLR
jgi:iron(III) transport system permease protein